MSAAPIADDTRIQVRRILIKPNEIYRSIFNDAAAENTNNITESGSPLDDTDYQALDDTDYQAFFALSIAKEAKALSASSGIPNYLTEQSKDLNLTLVEPFTMANMFGSNISSANRYKALSLNTFRHGKPQIPYIGSSIIVLQESLRAITKGAPLRRFLAEVPTTLFLYYRKPDGMIPIYSGHIFVQQTGPWLFFVSIYKSIFEPEKGLSNIILDDVTAYAKDHGFSRIYTLPLESMKSTLIKRGFVMDLESGLYMLQLDSKTAAGGAGVTQGGRKRKSRRKTRKRL